MSIVLQTIEKTSFSYEDVASLLHIAFQERLDQGLSFTTSRMSAEDFKKRGENGIVLVAYDTESMRLIGTGMTHFRTNNNGVLYAEEEHKGVHPDLKRSGIGSLLERELQQLAKQNRACYIISDTAIQAKSSIRFHLNNGFFKWKLASFPSTDYYSFIFRKQLSPDRKWDCFLYRKLFFILSCMKTVIVKKADGSTRELFKFFK